MTGLELIVVIAFVATGSCIQGSVGIGLALVAGPALVAIDPAFAPGPLLFGGLLIGARHAIVERAHVERATITNAYLGAPFGVMAGLALLAVLSDSAMAIAVGAFTVLAASALLAGMRIPQSPRSERAGGAGIAFSSVAAGLPGPPAAVVFSDLPPPALRGTTSILVLGIALVGGLGMVITGEFGTDELDLALLMVPGVLIGLVAARFTRPIVERSWFRTAVLVVALVGGLALLVSELT